MKDEIGLVKKLRAKRYVHTNAADQFHEYRNPDGPEAADQIEILTRQLEEARATIRKAHDALGPAVGDVIIVSKIAAPIYRAFGILRDALAEQKGTGQ